MVYCDQDMCESKLGRLMQAFRADMPSEWQMDEFIGMAEQMHKEIEILRQAEKDAARYLWLRDESAFAHGNAPLVFFTDANGDQIAFDFDGSSCSVLHDEMLDAAIDEAMQCSK
jgi:hypothetical protein